MHHVSLQVWLNTPIEKGGVGEGRPGQTVLLTACST